jgi:hypothetical protein
MPAYLTTPSLAFMSTLHEKFSIEYLQLNSSHALMLDQRCLKHYRMPGLTIKALHATRRSTR